MKRISAFLLAGALLFTGKLSAQDCELYTDVAEGTSIKMVHYDKKDKVTGTSTSTLLEKIDIAGGSEMHFNQLYDNGDDYTFENEFRIRCVNGDIYVNLEKLVDPATLEAYKDMEIQVKADDMSIPAGAKAGDQLNDGSVTVTVLTGSPVNITISVSLSNRLVEGEEQITTPAGTFDCMKISYDMLTQIGFVKVQAKAVEYYNSKIGAVKSESYNKKGKLTAYSVVEEVTY